MILLKSNEPHGQHYPHRIRRHALHGRRRVFGSNGPVIPIPLKEELAIQPYFTDGHVSSIQEPAVALEPSGGRVCTRCGFVGLLEDNRR